MPIDVALTTTTMSLRIMEARKELGLFTVELHLSTIHVQLDRVTRVNPELQTLRASTSRPHSGRASSTNPTAVHGRSVDVIAAGLRF